MAAAARLVNGRNQGLLQFVCQFHVLILGDDGYSGSIEQRNGKSFSRARLWTRSTLASAVS